MSAYAPTVTDCPFHFYAQVLTMYSEDDGETWSSPVNVSGVTEPAWTWVGTGPPSSLQLASGRIVTPAYHSSTPHDDGEVRPEGCRLHCAYAALLKSTASPHAFQISTAHAMFSDDGGQTWALGGSWTDGLNFPNENEYVELANSSESECSRMYDRQTRDIASLSAALWFL